MKLKWWYEISQDGEPFDSIVISAAILRQPRSSPPVQFSSVQDGFYALGKAHMRSTPSLRSFPNVALETVPVLV